MPEPTAKCQKKADPSECSEEQIRLCHGDSGDHPCVTESECQGAPAGAECTEEQIAKCHGSSGQHPCK